MDDDESPYDIVPITVMHFPKVFPYMISDSHYVVDIIIVTPNFRMRAGTEVHKAINKRDSQDLHPSLSESKSSCSLHSLLSRLYTIGHDHVTTAQQNSEFPTGNSWMGDLMGRCSWTPETSFTTGISGQQCLPIGVSVFLCLLEGLPPLLQKPVRLSKVTMCSAHLLIYEMSEWSPGLLSNRGSKRLL